VALATFFVAAVVTSTVSERTRQRAVEAERRRAEADLTAEMAQVLLAQAGMRDALALIGHRLAQVFELPWASISLEEAQRFQRRTAGGREEEAGLAAAGHQEQKDTGQSQELTLSGRL
jgi:two-component system sensor histidine kinase KdpD